MNKWIAELEPGKRYVIEKDLPAGYYLRVYDGDECVADHLQDSLEIAQEQAAEDYGVPRSVWRRGANQRQS